MNKTSVAEQQFGFLIERNTTVNSQQFANLIKESYNLEEGDERTAAVYQSLLDDSSGVWTKNAVGELQYGREIKFRHKIRHDYAESVIGGHENEYDALYVHGVKILPGNDALTAVDDSFPQFFSVYARNKENQATFDAVADFYSYSDAAKYVVGLSLQYNFPVFDYAGASQLIDDANGWEDNEADHLEIKCYNTCERSTGELVAMPDNIDGQGILSHYGQKNISFTINAGSRVEPPDFFNVTLHRKLGNVSELGIETEFRYYKDAIQFARDVSVTHSLGKIVNHVPPTWRIENTIPASFTALKKEPSQTTLNGEAVRFAILIDAYATEDVTARPNYAMIEIDGEGVGNLAALSNALNGAAAAGMKRAEATLPNGVSVFWTDQINKVDLENFAMLSDDKPLVGKKKDWNYNNPDNDGIRDVFLSMSDNGFYIRGSSRNGDHLYKSQKIFWSELPELKKAVEQAVNRIQPRILVVTDEGKQTVCGHGGSNGGPVVQHKFFDHDKYIDGDESQLTDLPPEFHGLLPYDLTELKNEFIEQREHEARDHDIEQSMFH